MGSFEKENNVNKSDAASSEINNFAKTVKLAEEKDVFVSFKDSELLNVFGFVKLNKLFDKGTIWELSVSVIVLFTALVGFIGFQYIAEPVWFIEWGKL